MENKAHALAAGAFVLALLALLVGLAVWLTRDSGKRDLYDIVTAQTIAGLQPQSAVRFRGVPVGKVESIGFDARVRSQVRVRLAINRGTPVTRSTFAVISAQGLTGLGFVQLDDDAEGAAPLLPDDANPPRIPLRPGLLDKLTHQSESILGQLEQVSGRVNQMLNPDQPASVQAALAQLGAAAGSLRQLAQALQPTVAALPALARQSRQTLQAVQGAARQAGDAAAQLGQTAQRLNAGGGALDKLDEGGAALAGSLDTLGASTLPKLGEVADEATRTLRQLRRSASVLDDNPQALIFGSGPALPGPGEAGFAAPLPAPENARGRAATHGAPIGAPAGAGASSGLFNDAPHGISSGISNGLSVGTFSGARPGAPNGARQGALKGNGAQAVAKDGAP